MYLLILLLATLLVHDSRVFCRWSVLLLSPFLPQAFAFLLWDCCTPPCFPALASVTVGAEPKLGGTLASCCISSLVLMSH